MGAEAACHWTVFGGVDKDPLHRNAARLQLRLHFLDALVTDLVRGIGLDVQREHTGEQPREGLGILPAQLEQEADQPVEAFAVLAEQLRRVEDGVLQHHGLTPRPLGLAYASYHYGRGGARRQEAARSTEFIFSLTMVMATACGGKSPSKNNDMQTSR